MKKITMLFFVFASALVLQAQENLLSNGDFEQGQITWFGNAFNVQEDGGNSFNFSDNEVSTNPFDVNLSHPVEIIAGETYTFSFEASTSMEDGSRTIMAGIGLNEGDFAAVTENVTVTSDTQTFTFVFTPSFGSVNSRALFDLGADDGVLVVDNVSLVLNEDMTTDGNLLVNGDFEQGMVVWFGNAFNVVEDGGNSFNQSDNEVSTNPFDVNLSHPVEIIAGETYTLSFDASTSAEDVTRTIMAGIGLNEGDFAAVTEDVTVTAETQTFTFEFTPDFGSVNSRALFDLGADDGILVLDNVSLVLNEETTTDGNLLANGDFEQGMVVWFGNAFNVVEDGGNSFNQSDNEVSTNPFDVNLSHPVEIIAGETYTLSFDASTSTEDVTRTILAGIGLNEGDFAAVTEEVTVTADTQTFTFEFTPDFGSINSRALFDLGADDGILVLDNVVLTLQEEPNEGDELLSNGDFELGMVTWFGNAFNVVEDGGNSFNQSDNEVSTNPFDVNLSHPVEIIAGETYTLSFDASTSAEDVTRTILAGIGLNEGDFTAVTEEVTVTADTQTFTFEFTPDFGSINSRALFDLGADDGILVLDNVSLTLAEGGGDMPIPLVAAPTPPNRDPETVFSIFSDAYTQQPNTVFGAFNVGTQDIETIQIEGDNTQQITLNQPASEFLLVDWGEPLDLSALTHFHMDYWIQTDLSTGLIANPLWSNHVGDNGETSSFGLTNPVSTFGEWVSIDVPLTDFDFGNNSNDQQRDALRQFVLTVAGADAGDRTIFLDNIYLHTNTVLSTEDFAAGNVSAFPNPTTNRWTITTESQIITEVVVYDILGKRVLAVMPNGDTVNIDATALNSGLYVAKVVTPQGTQSLKLLKQ